MVFTSISKNFINAVKSKPPLIVFTVCILGIIVTSLSLAYYVHNNDKIANLDAKEEWLSVLKYMNTLELCIENSNGSFIRNPMYRRSTEITSITMNTKISVPVLNADINVQGLIPLKDWTGNKCLEKFEVPEYLQVEFTLPKNDGNISQPENVCMTITGPTNFIPKLDELELCQPVKMITEKWRKLIVKGSDEEQANFCSVGLSMSFGYDASYSKELKFDMFLSEEDRLLINSHLIVTSCFLVCIVILITCYALFKNRNLNNNVDSKQLLMSKGMYL